MTGLSAFVEFILIVLTIFLQIVLHLLKRKRDNQNSNEYESGIGLRILALITWLETAIAILGFLFEVFVFLNGIPSPNIDFKNQGENIRVSLSCDLDICNIYYRIGNDEYSLYAEPFVADSLSTVTAYSTIGIDDWIFFKSSTASRRTEEAISDNPIKYTATLGPGQKVGLEIELPAENHLDDSLLLGSGSGHIIFSEEDASAEGVGTARLILQDEDSNNIFDIKKNGSPASSSSAGLDYITSDRYYSPEIASRDRICIGTPLGKFTMAKGSLLDLLHEHGRITITLERKWRDVGFYAAAGFESIATIPGGVILDLDGFDGGPGLAAAITHGEGTSEIIRKAVINENSAVIPLEGSAEIQIVGNSKEFDDVPSGYWAEDAIEFVTSHELFNGSSADTFSPGSPMTRVSMVVVLHNLESNPQPLTQYAIADVSDGKWYAPAVHWAVANGIASRDSRGNFRIKDNITREQCVTMLWRYAGSPEPEKKTFVFNDVRDISTYAEKAFRWAVNQQIIENKTSLYPKNDATRAEAAMMLKRFCEMQAMQNIKQLEGF